VNRASDGSYQNSTQSGGPGYDPAFEMNNQDATIGWVYRAKRDQSTGQPLFF
jgi:inosine/xanthosine triphosphate pyrophosphatase family protein